MCEYGYAYYVSVPVHVPIPAPEPFTPLPPLQTLIDYSEVWHNIAVPLPATLLPTLILAGLFRALFYIPLVRIVSDQSNTTQRIRSELIPSMVRENIPFLYLIYEKINLHRGARTHVFVRKTRIDHVARMRREAQERLQAFLNMVTWSNYLVNYKEQHK